MHKPLYLLMFLFGFAFSASAACPNQSTDASILLQKAAGVVSFADEADKNCPVLNDSPQRAVIWVFQDMRQDCMPAGSGKCRIELQQVDSASRGKVNCHPDGNDFVCMLNVHRLKSGCDRADPGSASCALTYLVFYHDQQVDPTIIINPRPSVD